VFVFSRLDSHHLWIALSTFIYLSGFVPVPKSNAASFEMTLEIKELKVSILPSHLNSEYVAGMFMCYVLFVFVSVFGFFSCNCVVIASMLIGLRHSLIYWCAFRMIFP
jgi:hypothetical protein